MQIIISLLSFLSPFILINLLPKTSSQTTYMMAVYLVIIPTSLITSFLLNKYLQKYSSFIFKVLIFFIILYSIYLFLMTLARYFNFRSEVIDLSYYDQVIHQMSQFKIPRVWDTDWFVWGDHFDGILFLFVPLYWLKREPAFLMAVQSGLAILTTIPIYLFAKEKFSKISNFRAANVFSERRYPDPPVGGEGMRAPQKMFANESLKLLALSLSFGYLLFGSHQMGYLYGFHEIVMFPFFFFWMLFFLETKKTKLFLLFLFLTTIIKEETGFYLIFLGLYYLYKNFSAANVFSERRYPEQSEGMRALIKIFASKNFYAILFIATGLLWYLFTFHVIFPNFYPYWDIHRGLYSGLSSIEGIKGLLQPFKLGTILNHIAPFGFVSLLYPPSLIVTIPAWFQKLLTNDIASLSGFHYSSAITALMIFAGIEGLTHYLKRRKLYIVHFTLFIIVISFYSNYLLGYSPSSLSNLSINEFRKTPNQDLAYQYMSEIPKEASVSASYILVPHLKKPRGLIYSVPRNNDTSDYVLLNHNISIPLTTASLYKQYLSSLEKNYQIIKSQNNVFLLKRINP